MGFRLAANGDWRSVESAVGSLGNGFDLNFEAIYGWGGRRGRPSFEVAYTSDYSSSTHLE